MTDYIVTGKTSSSMVSPGENGKDPWVVGLSLTLPLWAGTKVNRIKAAEAMAEMNEAKQAGMEDMIRAQFVSLSEELLDAGRKIALYEKTLIPRSRQIVALSEENYIGGTGSFLDFLDAQRMLLNQELMLIRQETRYEKIGSSIDMLLGGALTHELLTGSGERPRMGNGN
jgi:outer membrane protein TolC